jgi:hypothetical protein
MFPHISRLSNFPTLLSMTWGCREAAFSIGGWPPTFFEAEAPSHPGSPAAPADAPTSPWVGDDSWGRLFRAEQQLNKLVLPRSVMWVKQCHEPPMTGNGLSYKNGDLEVGLLWFYHVLPTFVICGDANSQQIARPDGRALGPKVGSHREDTPEKMRKMRDEWWWGGFQDPPMIFYDLLWSFMIFYVFFSPKQDDTDTHTHTRRNIGFSQQFSPPKPQEWNSKFAGITQSFWGINQAQPLGDCLKIRHPNSYKILICLFNRIEVSPMFRQTQIHLSEVKYG